MLSAVSCGGSTTAQPTLYLGLGRDFAISIRFIPSRAVGKVRGNLMLLRLEPSAPSGLFTGVVQPGRFSGMQDPQQLTLTITTLNYHPSILQATLIPGTSDFTLDLPADLSLWRIAGGRVLFRPTSEAEIQALLHADNNAIPGRLLPSR
jgi:hypothetical protein